MKLQPSQIFKQSIDLKKTFFGILIAILLTSSSYLSIFRLIFPERNFSARSEIVQILYCLALAAAWFTILVLFWKTTTPIIQKPAWKALTDRWIQILERVGKSKPLTIIGWSVIALVGLALLIVHARIIFYPYQMEYREGAILVTNQAFLSGMNPWKLENNPVYLNVYGFVYNLVLLPFAWLLGNKVWIYRLASFLAIIGQMVLIAKVLRKFGINWILTAACLEFLWLGQIYYTTPLARPDALGQLFFLATLIIPWKDNFSKKSLLLSIAFGWLGFYTKPYFILGSGLTAAYLFLFVSKKKGLLYGLGLGASLLVAAILVRIIFEAYFYNVIFSHWADTNQLFDYMILQTQKFYRDYWAFLLICLLFVVKYIVMDSTRWKLPGISIKSLQCPLIQTRMDFFLFIMLVNFGLIFFSLGRHNGTIQVYYYQLLTPFLLILTAQILPSIRLYNGLGILVIAINLLMHGYENLKPDFVQYESQTWIQLEYYLDESKDPLNSPNLTLMMLEEKLPIQNSGQTEYFYPYPETQSILYPEIKQIERVGDNYLIQRKNMLISQKFDYIFDDSSYHDFYHKTETLSHYRKIDTINLTMPHVFQKWQIDILAPQ